MTLGPSAPRCAGSGWTIGGKPEPEPQAAELLLDRDEYWSGYAERLEFC